MYTYYISTYIISFKTLLSVFSDKQMRLGNAARHNCSSQGLLDFYFSIFHLTFLSPPPFPQCIYYVQRICDARSTVRVRKKEWRSIYSYICFFHYIRLYFSTGRAHAPSFYCHSFASPAHFCPHLQIYMYVYIYIYIKISHPPLLRNQTSAYSLCTARTTLSFIFFFYCTVAS